MSKDFENGEGNNLDSLDELKKYVNSSSQNDPEKSEAVSNSTQIDLSNDETPKGDNEHVENSSNDRSDELGVSQNEDAEIVTTKTSYIKPGGHFNKPLIAVGVLVLLFLMMIFIMPGSNDESPKQMEVKSQKLPDQVDELTAVNPGDSSNLGNSTESNQAILFDNTNSTANTNANVNPSIIANTNANMPVTTTQTTTTFVPVDGANSSQPQRTNTSGDRAGYQQPRQTPTPQKVSEDFTVDIDNQDNSQRTTTTQRANVNLPNMQAEPPVRRLQPAPGTKISMLLNEPFRSGIETKVQATTLVNIKGMDGNVVIPSGSVFEIVFRPDEVNGRVLAKEIVRVILPDGSLGEINAIVKGTDGYAGLTGKLTKEGGSSIAGKILKGAARVGTRAIGSQTGIGGDIQSEIENSGVTDRDRDYNVVRSNRIVEVKNGTQFYLVVGTP